MSALRSAARGRCPEDASEARPLRFLLAGLRRRSLGISMDSMLLITIAAVSVAAIMSLVAWRVVREERRRSEARIAALAADIHSAVHPFDRDLPLNHAPVRPLTAIVREPRRHQLATIVGGAILVAAG